MYLLILVEKGIIIVNPKFLGSNNKSKWAKKLQNNNFINSYHSQFLVDHEYAGNLYKQMYNNAGLRNPDPIQLALSGTIKYDPSWAYRFEKSIPFEHNIRY